MWELRADYEDGTSAEMYYSHDPSKCMNDEQYEFEALLLERPKVCTWYSVTWIHD